jgi:hypothetical protein
MVPMTQAVEDCRMHHLADYRRIPINVIGFPQNEVELAVQMTEGNIGRYVELMLCVPSCQVERIKTALADDRYLQPQIKSKIRGIVETARYYMETSRKLAASQLRDTTTLKPGLPWSFARTLAVTEWILSQLPNDPGPPSQPIYNENLDGDWGRMDVETPALPFEVVKHTRQRRCIDSGVAMVRPDRYCIDQRIFRETRRRRLQRGTVMYDTSGSMNISSFEVAHVARIIPAGMVAIYGAPSDHYDESGILRIIAKDGYMLPMDSDQMSIGGGNVVDGPALAWLGRQDGPRIWICDGVVTGKNDETTPALVYEAARLRREGNIHWINPEETSDVIGEINAILARGKR